MFSVFPARIYFFRSIAAFSISVSLMPSCSDRTFIVPCASVHVDDTVNKVGKYVSSGHSNEEILSECEAQFEKRYRHIRLY